MTLIRPPVAQDPDHPSIELAQESEFQVSLAATLDAESPRTEALRVARGFQNTSAFVDAPSSLALGRELAGFGSALDEMNDDDVSPDAVRQLVHDAFGRAPEEVASDPGFETSVRRLRDSIIAVKHVGEEHGTALEALTNTLRDAEVLRRLANDPEFPESAEALRRHRRRSLRLPHRTHFESVLRSKASEDLRRQQLEEAAAQRTAHVTDVVKRYQDLVATKAELTSIEGPRLVATPVEAHPADEPAEHLRPDADLHHRVDFGRRLSELTLRNLAERVERQREVSQSPDPTVAALVAGSLETPRMIAGRSKFAPARLTDIGFRVTPAAAEQLSETAQRVLGEREIGVADEALDQVVNRLESEISEVIPQLDALFAGEVTTSLKRVGGTLVKVVSEKVTPWSDLLNAVGLSKLLDWTLPEPSVPATRGEVSPAGIADLLIIKQQLVRYEASDVAHIENVLRGERKSRSHSRRQETETLTFLESEVTTTEKRELESTSRFEMSRETSKIIQEDASLKAGLTVSGKYGPTVEFSASAEGSISRSKQEATKAAAQFSQDVTERSAHEITERVLERVSRRTTEEVTETNEHELNNVGQPDHVSGVYQWVNKVYEAQMLNYGIRTIFDFMVPEPASLLIHLLEGEHAEVLDITKPPEFTLTPQQVTEANYGAWVRRYGATDVEPPPDVYLTVAHDYSAGGGDDKTDYNHSSQLTIPEGYRAMHGTVGVVSNTWKSNASADLVLGRRTQRLGGGVKLWATSLDSERGAVPFALNTWRLSDVAVAVEVTCQRTTHAMQRWQADTHAKLVNAYRARLAEYQERLAAAEVQAGVEIEGRNPIANEELMRDELRRHCISILTAQHFDLFGAVDTGFLGLPQIRLSEASAEGTYVRFFEHAFEWEHLTWVTYPYFWGRKATWKDRLSYEDTDPRFNQFLKAGFCRVTVPARPGFEGAIDHFMSFGELWNGGPLPPISSDLYLPIADELAERLDRPGEEIPQGEPWLVRLPTTLVKLRPDDQLPRWVKDEEGDWVEA
ncbi:MAG: hypothetical protein R3325_02345 [Thermoanaerobaculia bacterium]|nr:hypothetical protein [Thermoanaerobaculia bacterium]